MIEAPTRRADRGRHRVALVTCARQPDLDPDDRLLLAPLAELGIAVAPAVWDDPGLDWGAFDLVVLRSPWDYVPRRAEFLAWAEAVPSLRNPAPVAAWNTDKRYLADLTGAPVVPTTWLAPADTWQPPSAGEYVIKPSVGAGSRNAGWYGFEDAEHRRLAVAHVGRLHQAGRTVMIQPYLPAVTGRGETALMFLADPRGGDLSYSHAIRKGPILTGPDLGDAGVHPPEEITPRVPSAAELAAAWQVLAAVPGGTRELLYARVDLIPGPDGLPLLVELELTEPSLFLAYEPAAAGRFAAAIAAQLRRVRP